MDRVASIGFVASTPQWIHHPSRKLCNVCSYVCVHVCVCEYACMLVCVSNCEPSSLVMFVSNITAEPRRKVCAEGGGGGVPCWNRWSWKSAICRHILPESRMAKNKYSVRKGTEAMVISVYLWRVGAAT